MIVSLCAFIAAGLYLFCGWLQWCVATDKAQPFNHLGKPLAAVAIVLHALSTGPLLYDGYGFNFSLFHVGALICCLISALILASSLRKPVENLFIILYPMAALILLIAQLTPPTTQSFKQLGGPLGSHILVSILAYSVLTIATLQALILAYQDRQLKQRHTKSLLHALPPIQTMEVLLFEMIWTGFILLTFSIGSGMWFLDDLKAQQVAHKTALSSGAWVIFAILLWGHHQQGWRGSKAMRWTLGGFVALMLAYFGSKLVLELILQRG